MVQYILCGLLYAWYQEANVLVDRLLPAITSLVNSEDQALLRRLANIQHAAGYIKSQVTRANETAIPFAHYQEMERVAHILNDQTLLNIALTYEGDVLQRGANVEAGATLALSAGSELRYSESLEVYQSMLVQWPHEQKVKNLAQLFQ